MGVCAYLLEFKRDRKESQNDELLEGQMKELHFCSLND